MRKAMLFGSGASKIVAALIALAIMSSASAMIIHRPARLFCDGTRRRFFVRLRHRAPPLQPYRRCFSAICMGHCPDSYLRGLRKGRRLQCCCNHDFFRRHGCSHHRTRDATIQHRGAFRDTRLPMDSSRLRRDLRLDSYIRGDHPLRGNDTGGGYCDRRPSELLAPFARYEGEFMCSLEIPVGRALFPEITSHAAVTSTVASDLLAFLASPSKLFVGLTYIG